MKRQLASIALCANFLCSPALNACEENMFWVNADYLYWKIQNSPNPTPLLATAPTTVPNLDPLLGVPGTVVLMGEKRIDTDWRSGGKFALGWRSCESCFAVEANYFFLPNSSKNQRVFSSGLIDSAYLGVPFFDTITDTESSSNFAVPGEFAGLVDLKLTNRMQGAELNGLYTAFSDCTFDVTVLAGFRYWNFNEKLNIFWDSPALLIPAEIYQISDKFDVDNNFYGGQIGLSADFCWNRFSFNLTGKVALGAMCERLNIDGSFIFNDFGGVITPRITSSGGFFALPSNIGKHNRTSFAVLPEVDVQVSYAIMDCLDLHLGYSFLYVNKVLWAGNQINRNINPTQSALYEFELNPTLVGTPSPIASFKENDLWVQGLNVGLQFRF